LGILREPEFPAEARPMTVPQWSPQEILAALPDLPRWVEARGMLLSGRCEIISCGESPGDVILRARSTPLVVVAGDPPLEPLAASVAQPGLGVVLCAPEKADEMRPHLDGWKRVGAAIHRLRGDDPSVSRGPAGYEIGILAEKDGSGRLAHLPPLLREEISSALSGGHVAAAMRDGVPVSFCYPVWETETLWDVSVDTLEAHRNRGLGAACAAFLIDHMRRHEKEPVWGAQEDNEPSLAVAAKLGFKRVDRMVVFLRQQ
jgi:GNAT superfamily N-acetyltransferase